MSLETARQLDLLDNGGGIKYSSATSACTILVSEVHRREIETHLRSLISKVE